jgi:hypothetical protein
VEDMIRTDGVVLIYRSWKTTIEILEMYTMVRRMYEELPERPGCMSAVGPSVLSSEDAPPTSADHFHGVIRV